MNSVLGSADGASGPPVGSDRADLCYYRETIESNRRHHLHFPYRTVESRLMCLWLSALTEAAS